MYEIRFVLQLETKQIFKIGRSHAMMALYRGHNQILKYLLSKGFKCGSDWQLMKSTHPCLDPEAVERSIPTSISR
eukprot:171400-Amorphochlora_amoeboformis.AAC.1